MACVQAGQRRPVERDGSLLHGPIRATHDARLTDDSQAQAEVARGVLHVHQAVVSDVGSTAAGCIEGGRGRTWALHVLSDAAPSIRRNLDTVGKKTYNP